MKIISYCDHCHSVFETVPDKWFKLYRTVIEHLIVHERPSLYLDYGSSWVDDMLKKLEEEELILSTECNQNVLAIYPLAINVIDFEGSQDVEYYHVCKTFSNYEALLIDEKVEEE